MERKITDLKNYNCSTCKFYTGKRRYFKNGDSTDLYVEDKGVCSNTRSKNYNNTVSCFSRNPSCHKIGTDIEALIKRIKLNEDAKNNLKMQDNNAKTISADTRRVMMELKKEIEKREKIEKERLEQKAAEEEAKRISEILSKLNPTDRAIYEGQLRRSLNGGIYNLDLNKYKLTSDNVSLRLSKEKANLLTLKRNFIKVFIVLTVIFLICFSLSWIPYIDTENLMHEYDIPSTSNGYWVIPVFVLFFSILISLIIALVAFFKIKNTKDKIIKINKKLEELKVEETKNETLKNKFKGINQLNVFMNSIEQFGPFIEDLKKDAKTITLLDKDKIISKIQNLYIIPVYFVTFIRILIYFAKTLSAEEGALIIDAMYNKRVILNPESDELKKIVEERSKELPEKTDEALEKILSSKESALTFEETLIFSRIFFEKKFNFSGE